MLERGDRESVEINLPGSVSDDDNACMCRPPACEIIRGGIFFRLLLSPYYAVLPLSEKAPVS